MSPIPKNRQIWPRAGTALARQSFHFQTLDLKWMFFSQTLQIASYYFKAHKNTGKSTKIHSFKALALDGSTNIFSCLIATMRYKMDGVCCTLYRIHDHGDMTPTDTHRWRRYLKHTKRVSQSVQKTRLKGQCHEIFFTPSSLSMTPRSQCCFLSWPLVALKVKVSQFKLYGGTLMGKSKFKKSNKFELSIQYFHEIEAIF